MTNRKSEARGDYVVGYGRPPKGTQFKPGECGNPKGRPRGSKNLITLLNEELERTVTIIENGKHKKISKREALAKQTVSRALNNDAKAVARVFAHDQPARRRARMKSETKRCRRRCSRRAPASYWRRFECVPSMLNRHALLTVATAMFVARLT
jgi:Family of unknown function (DUF5681)